MRVWFKDYVGGDIHLETDKNKLSNQSKLLDSKISYLAAT